MAYGLMDMFGGLQPQDPLGQRTDFGNALTSRGNAMIGMGMGLLQPYRAHLGESPYTNALQGWQTGSAADLASARSQQQAQMERERMQLARQQANREPEAIRLLRAAGIDPTSAEGREALFPKQSAVREGKVTYRDQEYPYQVDQRGNVRWLLGPPPGYGAQTGTGSATLGPQNPAVPGTTLYWPDQQGAAAPSTTGAGGASTAATGAIPPPLPGMENEPWSVQKAVRQKQLEEFTKTQTKDPQQEAAAKMAAYNVLTAINDAEKLAANPGGFFPTTGILGGALQNVYQPSKDLAATLDTIKANVSLDKLTAMRQASTTGASGLGAVTESEHKLLQASIAALEQSQSPQRFRDNLARVRATYEWIVNRTDKNQPPPFSLMPQSQQPATSGGTGGVSGTSRTTRSGVTYTVK